MKPRHSAIQRELKQRRPFATRREEGTVALLRTADLVRRRLADLMEPHGITGQQYNVLRILRGSAPTAIPTLDIADRMIERTPGITRLLDRLEAKKLVRRTRCADDRRQVLCSITDAGMELLARLDGPVHETDVAGMGRLTDEQIDQLIGLLDGIRESSA